MKFCSDENEKTKCHYSEIPYFLMIYKSDKKLDHCSLSGYKWVGASLAWKKTNTSLLRWEIMN